MYTCKNQYVFTCYTQRGRGRKSKRDHGSVSLLKSNLVSLTTPAINLAQGELFSELAWERSKWWSRIHHMSYNVNNIPNNGSWIIAHRSNFLHSLSGHIIHIMEPINGTNVWEKMQWRTLPEKHRDAQLNYEKPLKKRGGKEKENIDLSHRKHCWISELEDMWITRSLTKRS